MAKPVLERFWEKVVIKSDDECWEWVGAKNQLGYGQFHYPYRGHQMRAHRVSWIIAYHSDPGGLMVLHKCDNRSCVNPKHLYLGTQSDNMRDMSERYNGTLGKVSRFTKDNIDHMKKLYEGGVTQKLIALMYGISEGHVSNIITGRKCKNTL